MLLILLVGLVVLLACLYVLVAWVAPLLLFLIDPLGGSSSGVGSGWLGAGAFADLGMAVAALAIVLVVGYLVLRGGPSSGAMQRR